MIRNWLLQQDEKIYQFLDKTYINFEPYVFNITWSIDTKYFIVCLFL